jgi:hypothetical protein
VVQCHHRVLIRERGRQEMEAEVKDAIDFETEEEATSQGK